MKAEPRPLTVPIPGGSEAATVTVEPMVTGTFSPPDILRSSPGGKVSAFKVLRESRKERHPMPVPCFLIRHPSAGPILVDTGLHPSIASDPTMNLGRFGAGFFKPELASGQDALSRLREKKVDPASIRLIIMTHLHLDHASAIADFPDSTLIVTAKEWEAATTGALPFRKGYRRQQFDYGFDYRTVDYGDEHVNSYASFGRTIDLFGDGSIRLVSTPGDTAGHQSVLVRLGDHDMLIGGDAIYLTEQLEPGSDPPGRIHDEHNFRRSLQELRLFNSQYPEAVITPGHDKSFYDDAPVKFE